MQIGASDPNAMTSAQKAVFDAIASGPRGDVPRPFLAMLDSPVLADAIQGVGAAIRFSGALPADLREVAILAAAAAYGSGYEWDYHEPIGRREGLGDAVIEAARSGDVAALDPVDPAAAIIVFCHRAIAGNVADAAALAHLSTTLGRGAATDVVAIAGYYPLLALFLAAANLDHPVPNPGIGAATPLERS
ncbi:carboxymuconolactone decarboxylase family protein [Methylobrevis pamukkalensis]|uniref:Carboxymuconolactone decarboxylase family protein n=1 Tax=Methylobrevis pamukkalensis TaxID=1439726 RepID=A0A1E3H7L1_9HYPH|nr:carboxymuconolactone decarboxylase family protein [Methylobrevis pamukkalensis]ODN72313.1 Carboxymuconolactone decarboxylase family protein [Methylobrevis pamukkalensis]